MASPKRILIRLPNWLGDVLMARPFLHALAQVHGGAERRGVGPAPLLELLEADRVLETRDPWPTEDQGARRQLVDRVRAWHPDLAFVLPPSFSSAWFAWRTRAPERVGYAHEGRSVLLTRALRRGERGERHLSEEYLALLGGERALLPPPDSVGRPKKARVRSERPGSRTHGRAGRSERASTDRRSGGRGAFRGARSGSRA